MRADKVDNATSIGLLVLRVGVGLFLASHGWGKVQSVLAGSFDQFPDIIGIGKAPSLVLAAGAEFVCSLLVVIGLFTRLAALPAAFTMAVAAFIAHANDPLSSETAAKAFFAGESKTWSAKEPALLYLIPFLALAFTGAGRYSLDALLGARKDASASGARK